MKGSNIVIKKITCAIIAITSIFSACCMSANAAGNIQDTEKSWTAAQTANGTPLATGVRAKIDYTSAYVYNYSESAGYLQAWVNRSYYSSGSGLKADRYYGVITYNGASQNMKSVHPNYNYYLVNYVKEDGYGYAGIGVINQNVGYHKIAWSPDSI